MNTEQIAEAALAIKELRPRGVRGSYQKRQANSSARKQIEALTEQRELIVEVKNQLHGMATEDDAIEWLDANCPAWRLGPAPRGKPLLVEKLEDNDAD